MTLHKPYFILENLQDKTIRVIHNYDGGIDFRVEEIVSEEIGRLLRMAIEEGMRRRSKDIAKLLEI